MSDVKPERDDDQPDADATSVEEGVATFELRLDNVPENIDADVQVVSKMFHPEDMPRESFVANAVRIDPMPGSPTSRFVVFAQTMPGGRIVGAQLVQIELPQLERLRGTFGPAFRASVLAMTGASAYGVRLPAAALSNFESLDQVFVDHASSAMCAVNNSGCHIAWFDITAHWLSFALKNRSPRVPARPVVSIFGPPSLLGEFVREVDRVFERAALPEGTPSPEDTPS